jgi:hypothetical protein
MAKLTKKALIGIIVAVVVVAGALGFLLWPREVYDLSLNYKPGETYVYLMTTTTEVMGQKVELPIKLTMDILEVQGNEITLRSNVSFDLGAIAPQMPESILVVSKATMTNKGKKLSTEIESIEPPKFEALVGNLSGQIEQ